MNNLSSWVTETAEEKQNVHTINIRLHFDEPCTPTEAQDFINVALERYRVHINKQKKDKCDEYWEHDTVIQF